MPDLTPPPEQLLPGQARARIRAELVEQAQQGSPDSRRWLLPVVAAASVALVAVMAAWAVQLGDDSGGSEGAPATQGSSAASPEEATESPSEATDNPTPDDEETVEVGTRDCAAEMEYVLKNAEEAVSFPEDDGQTSFWVKGDRFVLCDVRAGTTTVHHPLPLTPQPEAATFRVSTVNAPVKGGGFRTTWVAGGVWTEGVTGIKYVFPADGHEEMATKVTDEQGRTWWRMVYAWEGPGGVDFDLPPITVTVALSGMQYDYELDWARDTCAQANHGC